MDVHQINHSKEPIRLFKSDFLEFFTHIHPAVIIIIWVPVIIYFFYRGFSGRPDGMSVWPVLGGFLLGLFLWTLSEYVLHRFLFHFHAKSEQGKKIFFLFHGVHHAQPQMKTRLVMPPVLSIPLALLFYGLFYLVFHNLLKSGFLVPTIFTGFLTGYLIYDLIHYATHHFPMRIGIWKALKQYHIKHHYKTPDKRYGVSSPLWDLVFRTSG